MLCSLEGRCSKMSHPVFTGLLIGGLDQAMEHGGTVWLRSNELMRSFHA